MSRRRRSTRRRRSVTRSGSTSCAAWFTPASDSPCSSICRACSPPTRCSTCRSAPTRWRGRRQLPSRAARGWCTLMIEVAEPWLTATISDTAHGLPQAIYLQLAAILRRTTGTELGDDGLCLMWNRLRPRLAELGCISFAAYLALVDSSPSERDRMTELMCTHETRFFREPGHFAWIADQLAPSWRAQADRGMRARRVRAWSAACSSGEE